MKHTNWLISLIMLIGVLMFFSKGLDKVPLQEIVTQLSYV